MQTLEDICTRQCKGEDLSEEQVEFLQSVMEERRGGASRYLGWYPRLFYDCREDSGKRDVLVADVHTDCPSTEHGDPGAVLHWGVGDVNFGYFIVNNAVYAGPVFSSYEFVRPANDRWNDKEFEANLDNCFQFAIMAEKPKASGKRTKKKTKSGGGGVRVRNGGAGGGADVRHRKASCCEHCFASWHEDDADGRPCDRTCSAHGRTGGSQPDTNAASFLRRGPAITSFYCKCAQLYGELHQATMQSTSALFTEVYVAELGHKVLASVDELFTQCVCETNGLNCPFVMLLSILMPSLRKFWTWTQKTSVLWFAVDSSAANTTLWSMIAMHDILLRLTMECERISHLIEVNEKLEVEQNSTSLMTRPSTSLLHATPVPVRPIPQVKRISLEFAELYEELKTQLADLSEAIFESVEQTASRLGRAIVPKESSAKARGSVTEFVDQLLAQFLEPLGVRALALQSPSRTYLVPTLLEKCISVIIEEFVLDNAKMNEILAARFEKSIARLLEWSSELEGNYNAALMDAFQSQEATAVPATMQRSLQLTAIDGFKRLEAITNAWLRNSKDYEDAGAFGRVKANLGGLRTTIARTISSKNARS